MEHAQERVLDNEILFHVFDDKVEIATRLEPHKLVSVIQSLSDYLFHLKQEDFGNEEDYIFALTMASIKTRFMAMKLTAIVGPYLDDPVKEKVVSMMKAEKESFEKRFGVKFND